MTEERSDCLICYGPLKTLAIFKCNHKLICAYCALKLRIFDSDKRCVYCKVESEKVFISTNRNASYEVYDSWDVSSTSVIRFEETNVYFEKNRACEKEYKRLQGLRQFRCNVSKCPERHISLGSLVSLKKHLYNQHKLHLCTQCVHGRKQFVGELKRYSEKELKDHLLTGSPSEGLQPHPSCKHCLNPGGKSNMKFFDNDALYKHLKEAHEQCHVCLRRGDLHVFLKDRDDLFRHFKEKHIICEYGACKDAFVAFVSDLEYKQHMVTEHPEIKTEKNIKVNFTVKRTNPMDYSEEGVAGVQQGDFHLNEVEFPSTLGNQRRRQFAGTSFLNSTRMNSRDLSSKEAFPALQSSTSKSRSNFLSVTSNGRSTYYPKQKKRNEWALERNKKSIFSVQRQLPQQRRSIPLKSRNTFRVGGPVTTVKVLPDGVQELLGGKSNVKLFTHNFDLFLSDRIDAFQFYNEIEKIFQESSKRAELLKSIATICTDDVKRVMLLSVHESRSQKAQQHPTTKSTSQSVSYKHAPKKSLNKQDFPALPSSSKAYSLNPVWNQGKKKLSVDEWLKQNRPNKKNAVRIGTEPKNRKKWKRKGVARSFPDFA